MAATKMGNRKSKVVKEDRFAYALPTCLMFDTGCSPQASFNSRVAASCCTRNSPDSRTAMLTDLYNSSADFTPTDRSLLNQNGITLFMPSISLSDPKKEAQENSFVSNL